MSSGSTKGEEDILNLFKGCLKFLFQKDETFAACLKDDKSTKHWLAQLLKNIEAMSSQAGGAGQGAHKGQQKLAQPVI